MEGYGNGFSEGEDFSRLKLSIKKQKYFKHEAMGQIMKARERLTLGKDVNSVSHFLNNTEPRDVRVI